MNRKQLILLLVVLAVMGGAGLILLNRHKESWSVREAKMGEKVMPNFQPNAVAAIHIKAGAELNVVRKANVWRVQERADYPANFGQISDLLIKLRDLKVVEAETVEPADLARVNLEEPGQGGGSGILVEFKDEQGKVLETMILGKQHIRDSTSPLHQNEPDGRYIRLLSAPKDVILISEALSSLQPNPAQWLSKDFIKVEKIKSISMTSTNAANSWKLGRETPSSPWGLADLKPGEVLNSGKVTITIGALDYPIFVDVAPPGATLDRTVTVETFERFTYTFKIGPKSPEQQCLMTVAVTADLPAERVAAPDEKPEDKKKLDQEFQDKTRKLQDKLKKEQMLAPWVYVVNSWNVDALVGDRAQFFEGKSEEKPVETAKPSAPIKDNPLLIKP